MRPLSVLPAPFLALLLPLIAADGSLEIDVTNAVACSRPTRNGDTISVHYRGTLQSTGAEFDASYNRGQPITFVVGTGRVIKGWDQGLLEMCPGEGRKLTIPSELGYGKYGSPPVIPGDATLIFETVLVDIVGVEQKAEEEVATTPAASAKTSATADGAFSIATAPSTPPSDFDSNASSKDNIPTLQSTPLTAAQEEQVRCHLLGPFALVVQAALGGVAVLSLVYKRWRETPKRPWKIFFFDVSKQVFGSVLLHVLNLAMSMFAQVDVVHAAEIAATGKDTQQPGREGAMPNPCSYYLLNLAIDTTIGIPTLYLLLKLFHALFSYTPLANPPESIKSGHYSQPPKATWWLKQLLIYFLGLTGMKLFVFLLFMMLPWLPWVGDWALRWTEGNEALQIAFAMFIFPLCMNALQYWIIDSLIQDQRRGKDKDEGGSYERVGTGSDDDDVTAVEDSVQAKSESTAGAVRVVGTGRSSGEGSSRTVSPQGAGDVPDDRR